MPISATGKDSGYTLIEVLVIIVLFGFIAVLASPSLLLGEERAEVKYIGELIAGDLQLLKEECVYDKAEPVITFTKNGYGFDLGERSFTRNFQRFGFSFLLAEEQGEEAAAEPTAQKEKPAASSGILKFNRDGPASDFSLSWQTVHYQGELSVNQDGMVNWRYERK